MEDESICIDDLDSQMVNPIPGFRNQSFFAVCDGHGGRAAAEYIVENLVTNLLEEESFEDEPAEALVAAVQRCCPARTVTSPIGTAIYVLAVSTILTCSLVQD